MPLPIGTTAPTFTLTDQHRNQVSSDDLKGRPSVVVFIPFPFTSVCTSELCDLRDSTADLGTQDANLVVVTCDTAAVNRKWAADNEIDFPVLSDYWPHGAMTQAYQAFDANLGVPHRTSYVLDAGGVVTDVIASDKLGTARPVDAYTDALTRLGV